MSALCSTGGVLCGQYTSLKHRKGPYFAVVEGFDVGMRQTNLRYKSFAFPSIAQVI